jgi:hypothetical protein
MTEKEVKFDTEKMMEIKKLLDSFLNDKEIMEKMEIGNKSNCISDRVKMFHSWWTGKTGKTPILNGDYVAFTHAVQLTTGINLGICPYLLPGALIKESDEYCALENGRCNIIDTAWSCDIRESKNFEHAINYARTNLKSKKVDGKKIHDMYGTFYLH